MPSKKTNSRVFRLQINIKRHFSKGIRNTENKTKKQNLNEIVLILTERHRETYKHLWEAAKIKIDADAAEYNKRKIDEMRL